MSAPSVYFAQEPMTVSEQADHIGGKTVRLPLDGRAYNPGLVRLPVETRGTLDGAVYLACVRVQPVEHAKVFTASKLVLVGLDATMTPKWTRPLSLPELHQDGTPTTEDGRLIIAPDVLQLSTLSPLRGTYPATILLAYTQARFLDLPLNKRLTFKQAATFMDICPGEVGGAMLFSPLDLQSFYGNTHASYHNEKNWQFFWTERGRLSFIYSFNPFVVRCMRADVKESRTSYDSLRWWTQAWGEPHGGTPPVRLPNGEYLTFFNSFIHHPRHQRRYVVGAITFTLHDNDSRAEVTRITSQPLLVGSDREGFLWKTRAYWEPLVVFATGCVLEGSSLRLAVGVNDCWSDIIELPIEAVLRRMTQAK